MAGAFAQYPLLIKNNWMGCHTKLNMGGKQRRIKYGLKVAACCLLKAISNLQFLAQSRPPRKGWMVM
jgi:hypothetical protein